VEKSSLREGYQQRVCSKGRVIGHQAVADQFYPVQGNALPQQIKINPAIGIAGKDKLPSIPTLGNVMRDPDCDHPGQTPCILP
jgi:hypothetical protein